MPALSLTAPHLLRRLAVRADPWGAGWLAVAGSSIATGVSGLDRGLFCFCMPGSSISPGALAACGAVFAAAASSGSGLTPELREGQLLGRSCEEP